MEDYVDDAAAMLAIATNNRKISYLLHVDPRLDGVGNLKRYSYVGRQQRPLLILQRTGKDATHFCGIKGGVTT